MKERAGRRTWKVQINVSVRGGKRHLTTLFAYFLRGCRTFGTQQHTRIYIEVFLVGVYTNVT